jgi:dTDP-4-dehydrorhamnose reductase
MRILLTGGTGRFGRAFQQLAAARHEVIAPARDPARWDLAKPDTLAATVGLHRPQWVVHAAAMSDVDACERQPQLAHQVNAEASAALARAARQANARFLLLSTDYVFDGAKGHYGEGDLPQPLSAYGASKLAAERLVSAAVPDAIIARTSVLFGTPGKPDFVSWAASRLRQGVPVPIADQKSTPTSTRDLAEQVLALLEADATGVFHSAGADAMSRLEAAQAVARSLHIDGDFRLVPLERMPWVARRPHDSSLNTSRIAAIKRPRRLRDEVAAYLEVLA